MKMGIETEKIEFKKTTSELKEGIISISAMLNKHGEGILYFGINDKGEIKGQEIGNETLRDISRKIYEAIKPSVLAYISIECIDNKNIIKVAVNGYEKTYSAFGKYYIRMADEDKEMTPDQLRKLMCSTIEDIIINVPSKNQDLSFNQLKALYLTKGLTINEDTFINNLGLKTSDNHYNLMAELLSDNNDYSIKVVKFKGRNKTEIINRSEYGFKCLILSIEQIINLIESYNETRVVLNSHQREEEYLFDMPSFKEAWLNACIHNSWSKLNSPAVYIFEDRLEIISTGGLDGKLSKEEFYKGISKPVNKKSQKIFGQLGYVEQTGHGIPLIVNKYGEQAFEILENFINVIIPFNKSMIREENIRESSKNLNEAETKIYQLLKKEPSITIPCLIEKTGLSNSYIRKILGQLKKKQVIERIGSNKTGEWLIKR